MTRLTITAHGTPAPQGSKGARVIKGRAQLFDTNAKTLHPWRSTVHDAATYAATITGWTTLSGPVRVDVVFSMPRPKAHFGSGRNADVLKPSAPALHTSKPDTDKLTRAVLDALTTAQIYGDDSQVAQLVAVKQYGARPGAHITVTPLDPSSAAPARPAVGEDHTKAGAH